MNNKDWPWPNFTPDEMRCKETGELNILPSFMDRLQALRNAYGKPMPVSSGYRSKLHSMERQKRTAGTHAMGCAVDIAVSGSDALLLIELALQHGFTGIGVQQRGEGRFIHLDDAPNAPHRLRPHIWSY